MEWKKASKQLAELLENAIPPLDCRRKTMFGAPVYVVNHNMFTGIHGDSIFIRLSDADKNQLAKDFPNTISFEPVKGHIMKEYLIVPPELYTDKLQFQNWLKRAFKYAASLPVK